MHVIVFLHPSQSVPLWLVPAGETEVKTVMKPVESAWNRMNHRDESVMKHVESGWIRNETICFRPLNTLEHQGETFCFVVTNTLNLDETGWNSLFHGHETPWITMKRVFVVMKHLESGWNVCMWSWNTLNHNETCVCGHETPWITMKHVFVVMKNLESGWNVCLWSWNTLNQDETVCFTVMKHILFHGNETPWIKSHDTVYWYRKRYLNN